MITHAELYQMLVDAEARIADERLAADVRKRSALTVSLIKRRVAEAGLTVDQLATLSRLRTAIKTAAVKFAARHGLTAKFPNG